MRMCTSTPAVDTRPKFSCIRLSVALCTRKILAWGEANMKLVKKESMVRKVAVVWDTLSFGSLIRTKTAVWLKIVLQLPQESYLL